jgi:N-methylhydantoinase B
LERAPERVLRDVIEGYVAPEEAEKSYGVAVRFTGKPDALVKLPRDWQIDEDKTARMRERMKDKG